MTGSATRKPRLVGGDKGRNKKGFFLAGKLRPVGGASLLLPLILCSALKFRRRSLLLGPKKT
jgi:hypothetical protein